MCQDRAMASYAHFLNHGVFSAFYADLFANNLGVFPLALKFILVGILWVEFFDIKVFDIGYGIGHSPGYEAVMPDDNPWRTRKTCPYCIYIPRDQVAFVPDGRSDLPKMRIVTEHWLAGGGHGSINYPVIACAHQPKAAELAQLRILF